jgi:phosphoribosylglycinamide formyltransferase 2
LVSQVQSEFELHAKAILGLPTQVALKTPGASAVIYGGLEALGIGFENVHEALSQEGVTVRLFGKPESFMKRRMGVALASASNTDQAREYAKKAAKIISTVKL